VQAVATTDGRQSLYLGFNADVRDPMTIWWGSSFKSGKISVRGTAWPGCEYAQVRGKQDEPQTHLLRAYCKENGVYLLLTFTTYYFRLQL
jgi:hypothetical protein